jgi:hypothetical protein
MKLLIVPLIVTSLTGCGLATESKSKPVTVVAPETMPSNFYPTDSSFLQLKISGGKFQVDLLKKTLVIANMNELDSFFIKNKALINPGKIVVTGFDSFMENKLLKDLFTKHGITKFVINTEENL